MKNLTENQIKFGEKLVEDLRVKIANLEECISLRKQVKSQGLDISQICAFTVAGLENDIDIDLEKVINNKVFLDDIAKNLFTETALIFLDAEKDEKMKKFLEHSIEKGRKRIS